MGYEIASPKAPLPLSGDLFGHHCGGATRRHCHAVQHIGCFHGPFLVRNDDQLGFASELGNEFEETMQVHVVECCFDLVHDVEGRWTTSEDGEEER